MSRLNVWFRRYRLEPQLRPLGGRNRYIQNQYVRVQIPTFRKSIQSDLYRGAVCFLFVSVYEGLFFQLVIVNYNPIDSGELMLRILGGCLEVA